VRGAEPVCLRWDLGLGEWDSTNLNVAVYLCNQRIYSSERRRRREPQWQNVSGSRPLRCVLSFIDPAEARVARWLEAMKKNHCLQECRTLALDTAEANAKPRAERYVVYEFVPKESAQAERALGGRITSRAGQRVGENSRE
jgi:hypothetical protein